jgi:hypothetical protein
MIMQALHGPHCQGPDRIRHGRTRQGQQRSRCQENAGPERPFLLDSPYAGHAAGGTQQRLALARHASGMRATVRGLYVSPTTVIKERTHRPLTSSRCLRPSCSPCPPRTWRWREGVRMRGRQVGASVPRSARGGATCAAQPSRAGQGTPWITTRARWSRRGVDDGRTRSVWHSKHGGPPGASCAIVPTAGESRRGLWRPCRPRGGRHTPRRSRGSTVISGPASSGSGVVRCAVPRRNRGTIW